MPDFLSRLPVKEKPKAPEPSIQPEPEPWPPNVRLARGDGDRSVVRPVKVEAKEVKAEASKAEGNDSGLVLNVVADQSVFVRDAMAT